MRSNERVVVICVATRGFEVLWEFCIRSHEEYCRRLGYEYVLITDAGSAEPHWLKFEEAERHLRSGANVLVIDVDAYVRHETPDIRELLARNPEEDVFAAFGRTNRPNSGFVVLRGGSDSVAADLLATCLRNREHTVPREDFVTDHDENGHFIHFLKHAPFSDRYCRLDSAWNRTYPPLRERDWIVHYTGPMRRHAGNLTATLAFDRHPISARLFAKYVSGRPLLLRILGRSRPLRHLVTAFADLVIRARGLHAPLLESGGAAGALWKLEFAFGLLERPSLVLARALIRPSARVVDGGAHVGYYTMEFAKQAAETGTVVAVEAHPSNFGQLRKNVGRNRNVRPIAAALADRSGSVDLHVGKGHSNSSLVATESALPTLSVPSEQLDALAEMHDMLPLDFLKLDVEGAELRVLQGADRTLRSSPHLAILIELNPKLLSAAGSSCAEVARFLRARGFLVRLVRDDFRLGPIGFVDETRTKNYLAASASTWREIERALDRS